MYGLRNKKTGKLATVTSEKNPDDSDGIENFTDHPVVHHLGGDPQIFKVFPRLLVFGEKNDQIGFQGDHRLVVGIEESPDLRFFPGFRGILAEFGHSDNPGAQPEREKRFGDAGRQRDDPGIVLTRRGSASRSITFPAAYGEKQENAKSEGKNDKGTVHKITDRKPPFGAPRHLPSYGGQEKLSSATCHPLPPERG